MNNKKKEDEKIKEKKNVDVKKESEKIKEVVEEDEESGFKVRINLKRKPRNGISFSHKRKYEVWFILLEGDTWQRVGRKKIRYDAESVNSTRNRNHLIDTTRPFKLRNKRIIFVDVKSSVQAYITSHEHLVDEEGNPLIKLDPEMQDFYNEKQAIKQVISGILGKTLIDWRIALFVLLAGFGIGWITYQMLLSYGVI